MNPSMLNAYPVSYSLPNDIKYTSRDRPYEYLERTNGLGASLLDQSMGMSASNGMDYKYNSNQLQPDGPCNTTNPQPILTPPQSSEDASSSIPNPPSSSFGYSTLPKLSASNAGSLDYYPAATTSFLPPNFNGASMTQAGRRPASLHMAPMSPPYNYGHTFSPYSMNRAAMPEFPQFSTHRNSSYDHPFNRGPRVTSLPGPFASSLLPFTPSMPQNSQHQAEGPPFDELSATYSLVNSHNHPLNFDILATIPKGFFQVENKWTCYRRNYFSVTCGFTFKSHNVDGRVFLQRHQHGNLEQVNGYAISISAKTAAPNNSDSEARGLVQHTPKRDKATETVPRRQSVVPTPTTSLPGSHSMPQNGIFPSSHIGPCLAGGLEGYGQAASQLPPNQVTFDRIQFQKATANNGKRRAQQQYFHVVVRLEVNVGRPGGQDDWIIVASRQSSPMVVRGRSPGHYKDTRRDSQTSMDPDTGSGHHGEGGGGGMSGYQLHPIGSSHPPSLGSAPGSYRHNHHYGTSFARPTHRVEESESSSTSRGSSVTLSSSSNKDEAHQPAYTMSGSALQGVCFDRMALSPMLGRPDTDQMDFHHSKKRRREEEHVDHYFQSALEASTYSNPSFDFSATSSQALCASS